MPVRIYEISRRLGLDNKEVLAKAKELGLTGVRAASSTLDKITAEYFESELRKIFADRIAARQLAEAEAAARAAAAAATAVEEPPAVEARPEEVTAPTEKETTSGPAAPPAEEPTVAQPASPPTAEPVTTAPAAEPVPAPQEVAPSTEPVAQVPAAPPATAQIPEQPAPAATPAAAQEAPVVPSGTAPESTKPGAAPTSSASGEAVSAEARAPEQTVAEPAPVPTTTAPTVPPSPQVETQPGPSAPQPEGAVSAPATPAPATPVQQVTAKPSAPPQATPPAASTAPAPSAPPPPQTPPAPPKPKVGDKIGFIPLPPRPQSKTGPKPPQAPAKPAPTAPPKGQPQPVKPQPGKGTPVRPAVAPAARGPEKPAPTATIRVVAPAARDDKTTVQAQPKTTPASRLTKVEVPPNAPVISLKPPITVRALAEKLNQKAFKIIADLMDLGVFANVNQTMDPDCARAICAKYGYRFELEKRERHAQVPAPQPRKKAELDPTDRPEDLRPRPPVVTVMGHVDHGKTTLLDAIRKSNVAAKEVGGITQHIGAYTISFPHPERKGELAQITFLDTPGHAAFSAMRARGANVTDIVVLVVAADDGVMPQTIEALNHARAAGVPIIVAINKMDHPAANPLKVRQQLQEQGLIPDDWGGDTIFVELSALTKKGVDKLLEMILLQADLLELKANPNRPAVGNIIESGISPGGPTVTALVRKGTLRVGDALLCGPYYGKVRALINEDGERLKEAGPSVAVKVLGLNGVPEPGSEFTVVEDERKAREIAEQRQEALRTRAAETRAKVTLENLFQVLDAQQAKVLKVVVKADTQGSVEAIVDALKKIDSEKVKLEIIHSAVGTITESDILLASASNAVVIGFHTRVDTGAQELAKREGVQIKLYSIIYELIDQVREAMAGLLEPITREVVLGTAEVKQIFPLSKGPPVAGCMVLQGRMTRGRVRVRRRKDIIYEGNIQSIRRFQDEVTEVRAGLECGIRLDGFGDFQVGDVLECYTVEKVAQTL